MHKHEWAIMYDGNSDRESVEIFALCITDYKENKHIVTIENLLTGNLPVLCKEKLSRQEIEKRLNEWEAAHAEVAV